MITHSAQVAIIGAGPAGAHLAAQLAAEGRSVLLFDPKGAWEKPCGGGVPARALTEFPFLLENVEIPRKLVRHITLISPSNKRVSIRLAEPFAVYSRRVFNGVLLDRAIECGAHFVRENVVEFTRSSGAWLIRTSPRDDSAATRAWTAGFLVGADGAASFTRRRLAGIFPVRDLSIAFGYNVTADESTDERAGVVDEVIVGFPNALTGYLWAFPRPGVINFGIAAKLGERTSDELRTLLLNFVQEYYGGRMPDSNRVGFFGAKIPTLSTESWPGLNTTGDRWALVGDAAGFADPITGEGIYYALKSADLLAGAIIEERTGALPAAETLYEERWRRAFGQELEQASLRRSQFFHGRFFGRVMTDAVVSLAGIHKGVRNVLAQALMGNQSYVTLKYDLLKRVLQVF